MEQLQKKSIHLQCTSGTNLCNYIYITFVFEWLISTFSKLYTKRINKQTTEQTTTMVHLSLHLGLLLPWTRYHVACSST